MSVQELRDAVRRIIVELAAECEGRGLELREVATGFRYQVREEHARWVARFIGERPARYSRALLETLALIAYRQPITRGEIEDVRGVGVSTSIMRTLHEREWIRVLSHRDVPGRPALYGITRKFLDDFGLKSVDDLPPPGPDPRRAAGRSLPGRTRGSGKRVRCPGARTRRPERDPGRRCGWRRRIRGADPGGAGGRVRIRGQSRGRAGGRRADPGIAGSIRLRDLRAGGRMNPVKRPLRPQSARPGRPVMRGKAGVQRCGPGQRPTRPGRGRGGARRRDGKRLLRMNRRVACRRVLRGVPGNAKTRGRGRTTVAPGSGPVRIGARAARSERIRAGGCDPRRRGGRLRRGTRDGAGRSIPGGARGRTGRALAAGPGRDPGNGRSGRMPPRAVHPKTPPPTAFRSASPPPG